MIQPLFPPLVLVFGVLATPGFPASAQAPPAAVEPGLETPTFTRDVAPILFTHCAPCHRPGESAPFSLLTLGDAKKRGRQIVEVTASRFMPPWLPEPGYGDFRGERRLSDDEIDTLRRWVAAGGPTGDPADLPPRPQWAPGWQLGEPDLVLEMTEAYTLAADGTDVFRNFVIPVPELNPKALGRYVRAVELRPGNPRIVHHAVLMVDPGDSSRRLDEKDPQPGFDGMVAFTDARSPEGQFLGWTPGKAPFAGYDDMAWRLEAGDDLVLQLHLLPSGKPESVRSTVGLFFAQEPPKRRLLMLRLGSKTLDIPASERNYQVADSFVLPVDVQVFGVYPHAHYLAREMKGYATFPDGRRQWLLYIKEWDFNWQDQYRFKEPLDLPRGTTLHMIYTYDNSAHNVRNPNPQIRRVRFGPNSTDEMGDLWIQLLPRDPTDYPRLVKAVAQRELRANIAGYRFSLTLDPHDLTSRFNLGSALVELGRFDEGMGELRRVLAADPDLADAHTNLGNALFAMGRLTEAVVHFRSGLRLEPRFETHFNLANGLMALAEVGDLEEAVVHFDLALTLDPTAAAAHLNKGIAFSRLGRAGDEIAAYEAALKIRPDHLPAHHNLAHALVRQGLFDAAVRQLDRALTLDPESVSLLGARADALLAKGALEEASQAYLRLIAVEPDLVEAHVNLGISLARRKEYDSAMGALRQALDLEPSHARAKEILEWVQKEADGRP